MLVGKKVKLIKESILNDVFLDILDNEPELLENELTITSCIEVDKEDGISYCDIEVKEIPGMNIYFNEYRIID